MFTINTVSVLEENFESCQHCLNYSHQTSHVPRQLLVRIINCSRHDDKVLVARKDQGADKSAHPSTHTADRLGVMTGAATAACPPITLGRQGNETDSLFVLFQKGVWRTPPHLRARWSRGSD